MPKAKTDTITAEARLRQDAEQHPIGQLSFTHLPAQMGGRDFWRVPSTGRYDMDWKLGEALAQEALDYVEQYEIGETPFLIGHVVGSMIKKGRFCGVELGFLCGISNAVLRGAELMARKNTPNRRPSPQRPLVIPTMPPEPRDEAEHRELLVLMQEMGRRLQQRNLNNAVLLAQHAAEFGGPLADHLAELGRRFGHMLKTKPKPKPALRLVKGGLS